MVWLPKYEMTNQMPATMKARGMVPASQEAARAMSSPRPRPVPGRKPNPIRTSCNP